MYSKKCIMPIITVLLLFILPLRSQIGVKGGFAISDVVFLVEGQTPYLGYDINYLTHRSPYITYQFGFFGIYDLNEKIDFQPELLFIKKGLNYSMDFLYDDITYKIRIHYLEVPLLLKYKIFNNRGNRFAVLAGPYISYMINNVRVREIDGTKQKDDIPNINKMDYGFLAGLSYDFNLWQSQYVIDLRSEYSLINMMERLEGFVPEYYRSDKKRARNVNISLSLGYYF